MTKLILMLILIVFFTFFYLKLNRKKLDKTTLKSENHTEEEEVQHSNISHLFEKIILG